MGDQMREVCAEREAVICGPDLYELLGRDADFFDVHGGHFSLLGHQVIAEALNETIETL
jgi:lysophospholipase L1-like esterase